MSMLDDYKKQEAERQEDAKKSLAHYKSVDLPGKRVVGNDSDAAKRIAEMQKMRELPNHE